MDLDTKERRVLAGPLTDRSYERIRLSANGRRLAFLVGPPPKYGPSPDGGSDYDIYVVDVLTSGGEPKLLYHVAATRFPPEFEPYSSGDWLLVKELREITCTQEQLDEGYDICASRSLILIDVTSGLSREVVSQSPSLTVYFWKPDEDTFAYALEDTLFVASVDGEVHNLPITPPIKDVCMYCEVFGWSPDGRYIGLMNYWNTAGTLDTTTGEVRMMVREDREDIYVEAQWRR
ncbi:MAG: hypothetical protein ACE5JL_03705 [Dehalococcoidia bacterium]